jgi:type I restriction enzyme R subunit
LLHIFLDADACPVKKEVYRVAKRYDLEVTLVTGSWMRIPDESWLNLQVVKGALDAADDWIAEHVGRGDIVVTADIPLAATLSGIYEVVRNAYARRVYVDRAFQKKTNELVQRHIGAAMERPDTEYLAIDRSTIETIKQRDEGKATKVINLVKSIEKTAEENSDDPFLVALSERAKAVQESFEDRQTATADALAELLKEIDKNEQRKKEQAAKGLDGLTYFVLCKLTDDGIPNPEAVSKKVREAFAKFPNWQRSEAELREVRKQVTFAVVVEEDDMAKATATVDALFVLLQKSFRP